MSENVDLRRGFRANRLSSGSSKAGPARQKNGSRRINKRLLTAASVFAIVAAPGVGGLYGGRYGGRAWAQALPNGCVSSGTNPNVAVDGDTVTCTGDIDETIATNVDDITVNIGNASTVATVNTSSGAGLIVVTGNGSLTINMDNAASSITGHTYGIYAGNNGNGAFSITATGDVTGTNGDGILAVNFGSATDLTINAAAVSGDGFGIAAGNYGSGTTSITVTDVTGTKGDGIYARNDGTDLTVTAAAVTGGTNGIAARNFGSGALSITATGTVTGTDYDGINATNSSNGTGLTINVASVSGGDNGIEALNDGSGALSITATGDVTGTNGDGINATNSSNGTGLTIDVAAVSGGGDGIEARNDGSGALSITATGTVTGTNGHGINASSNGTDLTVIAESTAIVEGAITGVYARQNGTGAFLIENHGTIRNLSAESYDLAIQAVSNGTSGVTITNALFNSIVGTVQLTGNDDTVNNTGLWQTSSTSDFGDGDDTLNNLADSIIRVSEATEWNNLETFRNMGKLKMADGSAGDRLTITSGNASFAAPSVWTIDLDGTEIDSMYVAGAVTIDGGTVVISGTPEARIYTILTAGGGLNLIDEFTLDGSFVADYELLYDLDNVFLISSLFTFCDLAGTANQAAVACDGLDSLPDTNDIVLALLALTTDEEVQAAYDMLSGEVQASIKGALMDNSQALVAAVNRRMNARFGDADTQSSTAAFGNLSALSDGNNGFWMTGFGAWGDTDATASTAQMNNDLAGVVLGADRVFGDIWRFGILGSYSQSDISQDARASSGSADTWSVGLYGGAEAGANVLSFGAAYNWHAIDTSRAVSFTGINQTLSASYDAQSLQLFAEAGHKAQLGQFILQPFAGVSYIRLDTDGYSETGGSAALTAAADTQDTTFTTLGLRTSMHLTDPIHMRTMLGWRHAFGDTGPTSVFTLAGSNPFTVTGAPIAENAFVTELGLEAGLSDNAFLGASYNGQFGDGTQFHGFNADILVRF